MIQKYPYIYIYFNLLTAEFSFKNPLWDSQVKSSNDEYTLRPQSKCSYYKFYDKSKAKRGRITFLFDKNSLLRKGIVIKNLKIDKK